MGGFKIVDPSLGGVGPNFVHPSLGREVHASC